METTRVICILVIACINLAYCASANNFTQVDTNLSCVQAETAVNASAKNAACIFYSYRGSFCRGIITSLYVFGDKDTVAYGEKETSTFQSYFDIFDMEVTCRPIMRDLYCRYHFPPCETSLDKPRARKLCRSTCEHIDQNMCKKEMALIRKASQSTPIFDHDMINCTLYDIANGGDAPECYQYYPLQGDDTRSTDCYYDIGVGYRGNVNITQSGRTCQSWSSQCPHRHWRTPKDVVDGQNDSNMCRNPDSSAPDGPWCYTTDPDVRWEYCNVSRCPPRVPEEAPAFLTGHPLNSTAIHISWQSLPPSRYKEQLLGYRVKYRRLGSQLYKEENIASNFTEAVVIELDTQTRYEIEVNGFNEIGHGPTSNILVVKTCHSVK
ncbi:hypothetical protein OS493_007934 [Desmophyllum pertusum]|uniref:Uncharacterized protein n=1 Tax=Desmophyllum pertusum TaxID=174260 RepID=A0A9W9YES4_9CNID|nr:hypothetical protein OS493_007934 [Desmophyllum pertusum]